MFNKKDAVNGQGRVAKLGGDYLKRNGVAPSGPNTVAGKPARPRRVNARDAARVTDEGISVVPEQGPSGPDEDHVALQDFNTLRAGTGLEVICRYRARGWQRCLAEVARDVKKNSAPEEWRHSFNPVGSESTSDLGGHRVDSAVERSILGHVAESVDVGANVATGHDDFIGGGPAISTDVIAMPALEGHSEGGVVG